MSVNLKDIKPKPEPKRDRWKRYLIPTGEKGALEPYTRATTVAKGMADTYGLEQWQQGQIANGMGRKPALQKLARSHPQYDDAKAVYREIVEAAFEASDGADGRRAGTALHKDTERLDLGEITTDDPDLDLDTRARLVAYEQALEANGIELEREHIEEILVYKGQGDWRIAGTTDRIARLADGRRVIADLKTSKNVDHPLEWAVQLAIYANHTHAFDAATEKLGDRIEVDRHEGLVIHLPSQGEVSCQLYLIDLDIGAGALLTAMERREWQKEEKNVLTPYRVNRPGSGGATAQRDWIADRIQHILSVSSDDDAHEMANGERQSAASLLVALWEMTDVPIPLPQALTPEQLEAMDGVCSGVEMKFELAIPEGPPGEVTPDVMHIAKAAEEKAAAAAKKKPAKKRTAKKKATKKAPAKKAAARKTTNKKAGE